MNEKEVRLIDANALMELYEAPKEMPEWDAFHVPIPVIRQNILDMPTIDHESLRPHGKWILKTTCGPHTEAIHCSICDKIPRSLCPENYCPNCGAKNV